MEYTKYLKILVLILLYGKNMNHPIDCDLFLYADDSFVYQHKDVKKKKKKKNRKKKKKKKKI